MIDLQREGEVFILRVDDGENRFRADSIAAWNAALDEVEKADGPKALVTTGTGKFYSNGLDLDWMMGTEGVDPGAYIRDVLAIMGRVLIFPAYTVAAINGHAFGAGSQLSLAHDFRVMRADRGYWCMPEIDMQSPLHPGMTAIIQARVPRQTAHELVVTGTRYPAPLAKEKRIIDEAVPESDVLSRAVEVAAPYASKAHPAMSALKRGMYESVLEAMAATRLPQA